MKLFKETIHVVKLADGTILGIYKFGPGSSPFTVNIETIYDYRENDLSESTIYC